MDIKLNLENCQDFYSNDEYQNLISLAEKSREQLLKSSGKGNDFLGWIDLPSKTNTELLEDINQTAQKLVENSKLIVVIGIGGSYLGARAVIEALGNQLDYLKKESSKPQILFAGHHIGEDYHNELLDILNDYDYSIIVISKSGTTTEPAIAFRLLKQHIEEKYGKQEAKERIVAITDKEKGALKKLSVNEGYKSFVIDDNVGGRFSVLSPVGLLPIAAAGFDINKLIEGAQVIESFFKQNQEVENNIILQYAIVRNLFYNDGKTIELLASYIPNLNYLIEWWKQLYGESEGKDLKGIFPAGANLTTDLHSLGQYIQDGLRNIFETVISIEKTKHNLEIPFDENNLDGLNYIAGKRLHYVNQKAEEGTIMAHVDGGVPNIQITIPALNEYYLGQLLYFFEIACGVSGYILDVNPFDQPGVEDYKRNMFRLLGKPS